jgi:protein tyrosine/serine phosphatase
VGKFAKHPRRILRQGARNVREAITERTPDWARSLFGPAANYADMLFVDHGVFRLAYQNRHKLADGVWRSAQPAPHQIRRLARMGIRTIVNLRGARSCGSYWLERQACARNGILLEDFQVRSRAAPAKAEISAARDLFQRIEYPMLMHCKSGADRVGLMSALYLIARENLPVEVARAQLALKYGHIRQADTGVLDYFFERYLEDNARSPMPFFDWVANVYDPVELKRSFAATGWANMLVNGVLRRE